jgi:tRNA threonylcarbamoyladenosine biosynthesis protein TsaE
LIETYDLPHSTNCRVHHLDLYRLADANELEMLAPRDLMEPGAILLIEWADKAGDVLPSADLQVSLLYPPIGSGSKDERTVEIRSASTIGKLLARSLQRSPD